MTTSNDGLNLDTPDVLSVRAEQDDEVVEGSPKYIDLEYEPGRYFKRAPASLLSGMSLMSSEETMQTYILATTHYTALQYSSLKKRVANKMFSDLFRDYLNKRGDVEFDEEEDGFIVRLLYPIQTPRGVLDEVFVKDGTTADFTLEPSVRRDDSVQDNATILSRLSVLRRQDILNMSIPDYLTLAELFQG